MPGITRQSFIVLATQLTMALGFLKEGLCELSKSFVPSTRRPTLKRAVFAKKKTIDTYCITVRANINTKQLVQDCQQLLNEQQGNNEEVGTHLDVDPELYYTLELEQSNILSLEDIEPMEAAINASSADIDIQDFVTEEMIDAKQPQKLSNTPTEQPLQEHYHVHALEAEFEQAIGAYAGADPSVITVRDVQDSCAIYLRDFPMEEEEIQ